MSEKRIFPIIPRPAPILDRLLGQKVAVSPGAPLTEAQKRLAEEFRRGIAEVLGVPPEAIREEPIEKWVREWTRAFVKPEYTYQINWDALGTVMRQMGNSLGQVLREVR